MDPLLRLDEKVNALIKSYGIVHAEKDALSKQLSAAKDTIQKLESELKETRQRLLAYDIGASVQDAQTRSGSRRKLDEVIRDIDKILMSLDE